MRVLIIRTDIVENCTSRMMSGIDSALTFEIYKAVHRHGITANNMWDKYTLITEGYIGTFHTMDKLLSKGILPTSNVAILTHEHWLDQQNPNWRTEPRYQYW